MEKQVGVTQAREKLRLIMDAVQYRGDKYVINRHGEPAVAVVPIEVYENWKKQRQRLFDLLRDVQAANEAAEPAEIMRGRAGCPAGRPRKERRSVMRVVLDANVFMRALISSHGAPAQVLEAWLTGRFDVLVSAAILQELQRVLTYDRLRKYARVRESSAEYVELISSQALWVEPAAAINIIEDDPTDNRYLECVVGGNAQYVVSGDAHLLEVDAYQGIRILSPPAFMALLAGDQL